MEDWDNIMTTLMVLSGALIIGVNILIWKLGKFRKYDSRRFINYTSRGDGEGFNPTILHQSEVNHFPEFALCNSKKCPLKLLGISTDLHSENRTFPN